MKNFVYKYQCNESLPLWGGLEGYQMPDFTQNYNRYSYCLNNPLSYTDPSGELWWIPMIIGAVVYGTINTVTHAMNGGIDNFWQGLGHFATGAVAGAIVGATWGAGIASIQATSTLAQIGGWAIMAGKAINGISTISSFIKNPENAGDIWLGKAYFDDGWRGLLDATTRYTWEGLQTFVGYNYTQFRNAAGKVDKVKFFGGATFAIDENVSDFNGWSGVSLGNYINAKISNDFNEDYPGGWIYGADGLYLHEYGHTKDSKIFGWLYLPIVGIASASGAEWTEIRANKHVWKYMRKRKLLDSWNDYEWRFPLE
ncbi:hypothetical protein LJB75_01230 [Bacteroidales bacterium OttesenSCG-928-L19]|nr:hypothetical protein [Bacteroidales bacterium OttesenSCG-928-L19]